MTTPTPETPAELAAEVKRLRRMVDDLQCRVRDTSNRATVTAIHAAIDRLATLAASSTAPAGFVLVPVEPTQAMQQAAFDAAGSPSDWLGLDDMWRAALAAAPAAPERKPLEMPPEIVAIAERLHTQDNRITDNPLFGVQQKRRVFGVDSERCDGIVWLDTDGEECEQSEGVRTLGYVDRWEFVTGCLTEQGCKDYIRVNGHNLHEPRIYAYGSYRNAEFIAVRKWLMSLHAAPAGITSAKD